MSAIELTPVPQKPRPATRTEVRQPLRVGFVQTETDRKMDLIGAGTYPSWIRKSFTAINSESLVVLRVADGDSLPQDEDLEYFDGFIFSGSGINTNDSLEKAPWLPEFRRLARRVIEKQIPTAGICLSHQVMAEEGGGQTGARPGGYLLTPERIRFTSDGIAHPISNNLPDEVIINKSHGRIVTELPTDVPVKVLATGSEGYEMLALGEDKLVITMQGHLEVGRYAEGKLAVRRRAKLEEDGALDGTEVAFEQLMQTIDTDGELAELHGQVMANNIVNELFVPRHIARTRR